MGKALGLILLLVALYVGMSVYAKGVETSVGGAAAQLEADPAAPGAPDAGRSRSVPITEAVRQRVTSDLQAAARRRGD